MKILDIEVVTHTDRRDDNCYGYNFNGLYLLWFAAFVMKRTPRVEHHLGNARKLRHPLKAWNMNQAADAKPVRRTSAWLRRGAPAYEDDAEQALKEIVIATRKAATEDRERRLRPKPEKDRQKND